MTTFLPLLAWIACSISSAQIPPALEPSSAAAAGYERSAEQTRRAPSIVSPLGPVDTPLPLDLANFLLDHPDIAAFVVHRHRIAPYRITMKSATESLADDGEGTKGVIVLLKRAEHERTYFGDGVHESKVFPPIHATALVVMRVAEPNTADCRPSVRSSFKVYVKLRSRVLSAAAKTVRVFVRKKVGQIFSKAFLAADKVGQLIAEDPDGISKEIASYPSISAQDRAQFLELIERFKRGRASCS